MPSERHIRRQIEWSEKLRQYGCEVSLEESIRVEGARVVPDVLAKAEGKTFIIEIGDIEDERKNALLSLYAKQNRNVEYIHEPYGSDMIDKTLESLNAYRDSTEYKEFKRREYVKQLKVMKNIKRERNIKFASLSVAIFSFMFLWLLGSFAYWLYYNLAIPLWIILIVSFFIFLRSLGRIFSLKPQGLGKNELELDYECPHCGQPCTKEEYESGYCLDCDQIEMNLFEES